MHSEKSDMSFALSTDEVEWGSLGLSAIFAQKSNLVRPKFLNMIREILRFGKEAPSVLLEANEAKYATMTLGEYLKSNKYSHFFIENYVVPMCAAIWSCSDKDTNDFPIITLIRFWANHHLLNVVERPLWRVVKGRSKAYVDAVVKALPEGTVKVNSPVVSVKTDSSKAAQSVTVTYTDTTTGKDAGLTFDDVIMACHSDQSLELLGDSVGDKTQNALRSVRYQPNDVYLHTDKSLMPKNRATWASWNCLKGTRGTSDNSKSVCVTYWVNLLQNLPKDAPDVFVTLNPPKPPRSDSIQHKVTLAHPLFNQEAIDAQKVIQDVQGNKHVYHAGAWCGYGFHEDGIKSAVDALEAMARRSGSDDTLSDTKTPLSVTPWHPRSCDPHLTLGSKLFIPLFTRVAGSWVPPNRTFKMLLPNGDELVMKGPEKLNVDGKEELGMDGLPIAKEITVRVYEQRLFKNAVTRADIGLGESYMNGDFSFESGDLYDLLDLFCAGHPANVGSKKGADSGVPSLGKDMIGLFSNLLRKIGGAMEFAAHAALSNTKEGSKRNIEYHYDAGNAFYELFLDNTMLYSSGIHGPYLNGERCTVGTALGNIDKNDFKAREDHLEQAQFAKIDAIIDRLELVSDKEYSVLEIGCGWGALAIRLCQRFPKVKVTGLTLSNEQHLEATKRVAEANLSSQIEIVIRDYRDVTDVYDAIVSIEMLEAVGHENLPTYFQTVSRALKQGGKASIQVITMPDERYTSYCASESDFIRAYIFPGGHLPSIGAMSGAAKGLGLILDSYTDIGMHYAVTLRLWRERMMANAHKITGELKYSEKFLRMFEFYFAYCEAGFARGLINDLQMTWVKTGYTGIQSGIHLQDSSKSSQTSIASAKDAKAYAICTLMTYGLFILMEDMDRNGDPHVLGIVKGTVYVVGVYLACACAVAAAFAAMGSVKGIESGKNTSLSSRLTSVSSPAASAIVSTCVAIGSCLSVFETLNPIKSLAIETVTDQILTVNTPVDKHVMVSLVATASASVAVTKLLAASYGLTSAPSPGVTRSNRDAKLLFQNRIVDSVVLTVCVYCLKHGVCLKAAAFASLSFISTAASSLSDFVRQASGYPGKDGAKNTRKLFDFVNGVTFLVTRVLPHLAAFIGTAVEGYTAMFDVTKAVCETFLYASQSGTLGSLDVLKVAAANATTARGAVFAVAALFSTSSLFLDFGSWARSARAKTAENAVRQRIIALSTSADV